MDCEAERKWERPNQGQEHLPEIFFKNNWHPECQENWEVGQWEVSRGRAMKVQCVECGKVDAVPERLTIEEIQDIRYSQYGKKEKKERKCTVQPKEVKAQPKEEPKEERDVRRIVRMITEVWMRIEIEKLDSYEEVTVKALLDSRAMGLFTDKKFVEKQGFKMQKLDRPVNVRNVNGTKNSQGTITHEIEVNIFFD